MALYLTADLNAPLYFRLATGEVGTVTVVGRKGKKGTEVRLDWPADVVITRAAVTPPETVAAFQQQKTMPATHEETRWRS